MLSTLAALLLSQAPATLTLDQALAEAEQRNLDLQAVRARLAQADEIAWKAWSGQLPQLSAGGTYAYSNVEATLPFVTDYFIRDVGAPIGPPFGDPSQPYSTENPPGAATSYILFPRTVQEVQISVQHQISGQLQLQQAILAPSLWTGIRGAHLAQQTARLTAETARREILFATAQLYYAAEALRQAVDVQKRLLEINRKHEHDAKVRLDLGDAPKVALLRAQIERARSEQDLVRTSNGYAGAKIALATLLNREPDFEVATPPAPEAPADPAVLIQQAPALRPDIGAAQASLELAQNGRLAAIARYAPSLFGFARVQTGNVTGFTGERTSWTAGAQLSWNLFDGGLRESELRESGARIAESRAQLESAQLKARDEIRRSWLDLQSAEANLVKAREQLRLARENAAVINKSFEAGAVSYIEVVDANGALTAAELNAISEQLNAQLAAIKVAKVAGLFGGTTP